MRISDWSSDVCSSDLLEQVAEVVGRAAVGELRRGLRGGGDGLRMDALALHLRDAHGVHADPDDDGQDDHREGGKEGGAGNGRPSMNGLATLALTGQFEINVVSTATAGNPPLNGG